MHVGVCARVRACVYVCVCVCHERAIAFPLFRVTIYASTPTHARCDGVLIDIEDFNYNIGAARGGIYDRRRVARISKLY